MCVIVRCLFLALLSIQLSCTSLSSNENVGSLSTTQKKLRDNTQAQLGQIKGNFGIFLTDEPSKVYNNIFITLQKIQVKSEDGIWHDIDFGLVGKRIDLLTLQDEKTLLIGDHTLDLSTKYVELGIFFSSIDLVDNLGNKSQASFKPAPTIYSLRDQSADQNPAKAQGSNTPLVVVIDINALTSITENNGVANFEAKGGVVLMGIFNGAVFSDTLRVPPVPAKAVASTSRETVTPPPSTTTPANPPSTTTPANPPSTSPQATTPATTLVTPPVTTPSTSTGFSIGGIVTGLTGTLVLQNNGGDALTLLSNGPLTFATKIAGGQSYATTIQTQPAGQSCAVSNGTGTATADVDSVTATCISTSSTYFIGGNISGLIGAGLVLQNSGGDNLPVSSDGLFTFSTRMASNQNYSATVLTNPTGQICALTNSNGFPVADISNVEVECISSSALSTISSYSISGTVSYSGTKAGPIYIQVYNSGCTNCDSVVGGTYIASPGPYTIRGLKSGAYNLRAYMDTTGTGEANANNPLANVTATITTADLSAINISLTDPTTPTPVTPSINTVITSNNSAIVLHNIPRDSNNQEIANSYKIYWGTDPAATTGAPVTFSAHGNKNELYIFNNLNNGAVLYFKISSFVGSTESPLSSIHGPVTIGATTGLNTVSGTMTFDSPPGGTMIVGLFGNNGIYFKKYTDPVNGINYSVSGVPAGTYLSFAFLDRNNNGIIDTGDLNNTNNDSAPSITVGSGINTSNLTLISAATAIVKTSYFFNITNNSSNYNLSLSISNGGKRAVAVTLISGPNVPFPLDMGFQANNNSTNLFLGSTSPSVGDKYVFRVTYSDASSEVLVGRITAVLGANALANNLTTVTSGGSASTSTPLFTWTAPTSPPSLYTYRFRINGSDASWRFPNDNGMPSTQLQVSYNTDGRASKNSLSSGKTYVWEIEVRDANGNTATSSTSYTVP